MSLKIKFLLFAVIDSWAKEPAGLYSHVSAELGNFDQCIELDEVFPSQHCQLVVENQKNTTYILGLCFPNSCSAQTIRKMMSLFLNNVNISLKHVMYCTNDETSNFSAGQWAVLIVFIIIFLLALCGTVYELIGGQGLLISCSLYRNANRLFNQNADFGSMNCLNGMRVLSMLWVVLLHSNAPHDIYYLMNLDKLKKFKLTFYRAFIKHGDLAVDTFFVMGGLLVAFNFMKAFAKRERFNIAKFYLHRYLRLIPVYLTVVLFVVAFADYTSSGPFKHVWTGTNFAGNCEKYWWSALLLVQNYVNPTNFVSLENLLK